MDSHFHVPDHYFLSHSVGCLPKTTPQFLQDNLFGHWQDKGGNAWPNWLAVIEGFRTHMGAFLGVAQSDICPQTNVSSALTKLLYSLPKRAGRDIIVLSKQDFPTIGFVLKQAERMGYKLRFVDGNIPDPNVWHEAIDARVQLVHITHAVSNTSQLLPVYDICKMAREHEVFSVVDIAQSVGAVPIDVRTWQADFVIGSSVKFLCGGAGAGFLYVAPETLPQCEPLDVGWFSHENPFEMDMGNFRFASDALRFFGGSPSPMPFASALNALKLWRDIGAPYAHIQASLTELTESAPEHMIVSPLDPTQRGGTFVLNPPQRERFHTQLKAQNIQYDKRQEGFRFSVHGYTPKDDIEVLKSILAAL